MPKLIKKGYNSTKEIFQSKPKSLTMQEVLEIVDELEKVFNKKGEDTGIRLVKSKKELDELWYKITNGESNVKSAIDSKGYPMKYKYLDNRKIHIDIHQNKGMK